MTLTFKYTHETEAKERLLRQFFSDQNVIISGFAVTGVFSFGAVTPVINHYHYPTLDTVTAVASLSTVTPVLGHYHYPTLDIIAATITCATVTPVVAPSGFSPAPSFYYQFESLNSSQFVDSIAAKNLTAVGAQLTCTAGGLIGNRANYASPQGIAHASRTVSDMTGLTSNCVMTVSLWFYVSNLPDHEFLFSLVGPQNSTNGYPYEAVAWCQRVSATSFRINNIGAGPVLNTATVHHLLWRGSGSNASGQVWLNINGGSKISGGMGTVPSVNQFRVGSHKDYGGSYQSLQGWIDELAVWNSVLTDAQALEVYQRGAALQTLA